MRGSGFLRGQAHRYRAFIKREKHRRIPDSYSIEVINSAGKKEHQYLRVEDILQLIL